MFTPLVYHDQMSSLVFRNKYKCLVSHIVCEFELQFTGSVLFLCNPCFVCTKYVCLWHSWSCLQLCIKKMKFQTLTVLRLSCALTLFLSFREWTVALGRMTSTQCTTNPSGEIDRWLRTSTGPARIWTRTSMGMMWTPSCRTTGLQHPTLLLIPLLFIVGFLGAVHITQELPFHWQ